MKKVVSLIVAVVLAVSCCAMSVCAAPSPEVDDVITSFEVVDANGKKVVVRLIKMKEHIDILNPTSKDEVSIGQYTVEIEGTPAYPITLTANIAGIKPSSKVYVIAQKPDGTIEKIDATVISEGKVQFKFSGTYQKCSVITDKKTASSIGVSDKTSDNSSAIAIAVLSLTVVAAAVSLKRIKA